MKYSTVQEIETIKERTIKINLSDADCDRLAKKAGSYGFTVSKILESFIGDLVDGTYSNGSDERRLAEEWFECRSFGLSDEDTLLKYLINMEYDIEDCIDAYEELKYYELYPQKFTNQILELKDGDKLWFEEEYHYFIDDYLKENKGTDIEKEIILCKKWVNNLQKLKLTNERCDEFEDEYEL